MEISNTEYKERINWNLAQKIDHSLMVIDSYINNNKDSVVAFSGGIDSTVMLYLVRMLDKNKKAVFSNTTNEFSDIIRFVKKTDNIEIVNPVMSFENTVKKYGFPLISKMTARKVHDIKYPTGNNDNTVNLYKTGINKKGEYHAASKLAKKWFFLIDQEFDITNKCCDILKKNPMKKLSKNGVLIGTMATDSESRKISYKKTGCINIKENKCQPISIWTKQNIFEFIKKYKIKYSSIYDKGETNTGCAYCGFGCQFDTTRFERLKKLEPIRYERMMNLENNGVTYYRAIEMILKKSNRQKKRKH